MKTNAKRAQTLVLICSYDTVPGAAKRDAKRHPELGIEKRGILQARSSKVGEILRFAVLFLHC